MRSLIIAFALLAFSSAVAYATPYFTSPGWYEVADTIVGPFLWSGPYGDEASCQAARHPDEDDAEYSCSYFDARPDFDD